MAKKSQKTHPTPDTIDLDGPETGPGYHAVMVTGYPASLLPLIWAAKECERFIDQAANGPAVTLDDLSRLRGRLGAYKLPQEEWWSRVVRKPPDDPDHILNHARHNLWMNLQQLIPKAVLSIAIAEKLPDPGRLLNGGMNATVAWMELEAKASNRRTDPETIKPNGKAGRPQSQRVTDLVEHFSRCQRGNPNISFSKAAEAWNADPVHAGDTITTRDIKNAVDSRRKKQVFGE